MEARGQIQHSWSRCVAVHHGTSRGGSSGGPNCTLRRSVPQSDLRSRSKQRIRAAGAGSLSGAILLSSFGHRGDLSGDGESGSVPAGARSPDHLHPQGEGTMSTGPHMMPVWSASAVPSGVPGQGSSCRVCHGQSPRTDTRRGPTDISWGPTYGLSSTKLLSLSLSVPKAKKQKKAH